MIRQANTVITTVTTTIIKTTTVLTQMAAKKTALKIKIKAAKKAKKPVAKLVKKLKIVVKAKKAARKAIAVAKAHKKVALKTKVIVKKMKKASKKAKKALIVKVLKARRVIKAVKKAAIKTKAIVKKQIKVAKRVKKAAKIVKRLKIIIKKVPAKVRIIKIRILKIRIRLLELDEILNYDYRRVMERLAHKKELFPQFIHDKPFTNVLRKLDFDSLHRDHINKVEICPNSKLLAAASSDGTITFVDLENLQPFADISIKEPSGLGIKSVALDNKNNVAYVNEKNVLRIYSLLYNKHIAMYAGDTLTDYTDSIPQEVIQFTGGYHYLAFRGTPHKITLFDMATQQKSKEFTYKEEKIVDYSISQNLEYIALVGYYGSFTKIKDCVDDSLVCDYKFDFPIHCVECMSDNKSIVYGLGNGQIAHLRYDCIEKKLECVRLMEN